jgi:hypothetical protein
MPQPTDVAALMPDELPLENDEAQGDLGLSDDEQSGDEAEGEAEREPDA